jgi:hypothetical protein
MRLVWWLYWVDGHWTSSGIEARLRYIFGKLINGNATAAVFIVSAAAPSDARAGEAAQHLLDGFPDLGGPFRGISQLSR